MVELYQFMSDYILAIMFLRVFFVLKSIARYSIYTDAFSKKLCRDYNFYPGFRFIYKSRFITNPSATVTMLFVCSICVLSYLLRIFEMGTTVPYIDNAQALEGAYFN